MITHATIIPLIGGEALASTEVFGDRPEYVLSYEIFGDNEKHLKNYWQNEVNWYLLDKNQRHPKKVDVVSSVCPCAGLSMYSTAFGSDNPKNMFMRDTAKYVLGEVRPEVFWGENAPGLAGKIGKGVREDLMRTGKENGYTMSIYRTRSLLHGVPQVRERSFYFFWKGDRVPVLNYYKRPYTRIEDLMLSTKGNTQREPINPGIPTEDPYYRFILEEIHQDKYSHREFAKEIGTSWLGDSDVLNYIEHKGYTYDVVGEWMMDQARACEPDDKETLKIYPREAARCGRMYDKITVQGKNIMRRQTIIPHNRIGAFVGHYPTSLAHPVEDRYVDYREAMTIMGLPQDYELLDPKKSVNHICQNVPYDTAKDMATEVREYLLGNRKTVKADYVLQHNHTQRAEYSGDNMTLEEFINL